MANVEINDIAAKVTPLSTDEIELQATAGGTSNKATLANVTKGLSLAVAAGAQGVISGADKTKLDALSPSGRFNNQVGTTYTIVASDNGKVLTFNNAASIAVTLPDTLDTDFQCSIVQIGAGVPTVTPATDTINGAGTGVTPSAQWKAMYLSQYAATTWLAVL